MTRSILLFISSTLSCFLRGKTGTIFHKFYTEFTFHIIFHLKHSNFFLDVVSFYVFFFCSLSLTLFFPITFSYVQQTKQSCFLFQCNQPNANSPNKFKNMLRLLLFPVDYDYHTLCQLHFLLHSRTRFFYTIRKMLDAEIRQNIRPYITSTEYTLTTSLLSTKLFYTIRFFQYDKVIKPGCICTALCIVDNFIHSHFILCCACSQ